MSKETLEEKLQIGTQIRIGEEYSKTSSLKSGEVITLIKGHFEYDNGLYTENQTAPSIQVGEYMGIPEFDSIYHLFGNDLGRFMDCEIVNPLESN